MPARDFGPDRGRAHPLREALHMWAGPLITIAILLIFILGTGRHLHG